MNISPRDIKMECTGDGFCLRQCHCVCDDENNCNCEHPGHSNGTGYCPGDHCVPVKCKTCGKLVPQWLLNMNKNKCINCSVILGPCEFVGSGECNICFENKEILRLKCGHELCSECWSEIREVVEIDEDICVNKYVSQGCPFCRQKNQWDSGVYKPIHDGNNE